ncbi:MAG TPA: hypothetical protein VM782_20885 [Stellaceae bacterium]|nr:hypothetical protein [Stellaceae bacterium]
MTGGQIAALVFAVLLLLPGGCFVFVALSERTIDAITGSFFAVGVLILSGSIWLFWIAFRGRTKPKNAPDP